MHMSTERAEIAREAQLGTNDFGTNPLAPKCCRNLPMRHVHLHLLLHLQPHLYTKRFGTLAGNLLERVELPAGALLRNSDSRYHDQEYLEVHG